MTERDHANAPGTALAESEERAGGGGATVENAANALRKSEPADRGDRPLSNPYLSPRATGFAIDNRVLVTVRHALSSAVRGPDGLTMTEVDAVIDLLEGPRTPEGDPAIANDPMARLRELSAQAELQELDLRRTIAAAVAAGHNQQTIGKEANLSQPSVSRLIARLHRHPEVLAETPRELLLRREAGQITTTEMLGRLSEWPWTFGHPDDDAPEGAESWVPGTWDDLIGLNRELLREGEYDEIRERVTASMTDVQTGV